MLIWPDNTTQEVVAAETLGRHLAGLGYAVGLLQPVGQSGTGADAADLAPSAVLTHLRSEPARWIYPSGCGVTRSERGRSACRGWFFGGRPGISGGDSDARV